MQKILVVLFILGVIYLIWPIPKSVFDFPPLPNSIKSDLDGDTWQNNNLVAYYSNFRRDEITKFYKDFYSIRIFGIKIPPIRLNHPPENAYTYVRDQQESTFLEEYVYPFKASIFVNGYEPAVENKMHNIPTDFVGDTVGFKEVRYASKTTLKYYPTRVLTRVLIYIGVWVMSILLFKTLKRAVKGN